MKPFDAKPLVRQINPDVLIETHLAPRTRSDKGGLRLRQAAAVLRPTASLPSAMATARWCWRRWRRLPGMVGGLWQHLTALRTNARR